MNENDKKVIERSETECIKCVMWDEAAKPYGKRGMCQECFDKNCVSIKFDKESK